MDIASLSSNTKFDINRKKNIGFIVESENNIKEI